MADNTQTQTNSTVKTTLTLGGNTPTAVTTDQTPPPPAQADTTALGVLPAMLTNDNAVKFVDAAQAERITTDAARSNTLGAGITASSAGYNTNLNRVLVNYELTPEQASKFISTQNGMQTFNGNAYATMGRGANSLKPMPQETAIKQMPNGNYTVQVSYEVTDKTAFLKSAFAEAERTSVNKPTGTPTASQAGVTTTNNIKGRVEYNGADSTVTATVSGSSTDGSNTSKVSAGAVVNTRQQPNPANAIKTITPSNYALIITADKQAQQQTTGTQQQQKVIQPQVKPGM
jgi:hypothetical protein